MNLKLSKYCYFYDLTDSAKHPELVQQNRDEAKDYLNNLSDVSNIVDKIFDAFGKMDVSSGFRGTLLNKAVGGSSTSQHCRGQAVDLCRADLDWAKLDEICTWIVKSSGINFGQLIRERGFKGEVWIHVSTGTKRQFMDQEGGKYTVRYI